MSAAENSSEANSDDPSDNQDQINHMAQPIQSSYSIPGNNNMGSMGIPHGYYSYPYMPFSTYLPPMMPNLFMPFGQQIHPAYLHNQQLQPQMLMSPPAAPMMIYNPMLAGNQQHSIINSNHNAYTPCSTQSMHYAPSMNDGVLENPLVANLNEPSINEISQNTPSTEMSSVAMAGASTETHHKITNSQGFNYNLMPTDTLVSSEACKEQSEQDAVPQGFNDNLMPTDTSVSLEACKEQSDQDAVPQPLDDGVSILVSLPLSEIDASSCQGQGSSALKTSPEVTDGNSVPCTTSAPPSTPPPKTLDCSSNTSPTPASESGMSAALTIKAPQKRRYRSRYTQCHCPNCKADDYNRPRFGNGARKHNCHFRNCSRVFNRPVYLKEHLKWHGEKSEPSSCQGRNSNSDGNKNERGQYICKIPNCGKVFPYSWVLRRHLRWHSNKKNFVCQYCDREYALEVLLINHVKNVHKIKTEYVNSNGRPLASCSVREASPQKMDIDFNLEQSTSSKYACSFDKCEKVYMSFNRLKEHTKYHFGAAPYVCPSCGKEFTRISYLQAHRVVHTDEKK